MNHPTYLAIGHISKDLRPDGSAVGGGTALYAALTAQRLGTEAGLVTAVAAPDGGLLHPAMAAGVSCVVNPSPATTTFENRYEGEFRRQVLHAQAAQIWPGDVPRAWRDAPIVHLGPVAQEMLCNATWATLFPNAIIGVTPQGWMRAWRADGTVYPVPWLEAAALLPSCHVLVVSNDDAGGNRTLLDSYVRLSPLALITAGSDAASIYERGRLVAQVPALTAEPVDFTGAGDVFAAAFLVAYHETGDPIRAARFAHAAAAFAIEAEGTEGITTRPPVETRLLTDHWDAGAAGDQNPTSSIQNPPAPHVR
jgi:sugar/nucleoside kinase (ribokinase family)